MLRHRPRVGGTPLATRPGPELPGRTGAARTRGTSPAPSGGAAVNSSRVIGPKGSFKPRERRDDPRARRLPKRAGLDRGPASGWDGEGPPANLRATLDWRTHYSLNIPFSCFAKVSAARVRPEPNTNDLSGGRVVASPGGACCRRLWATSRGNRGASLHFGQPPPRPKNGHLWISARILATIR